MVLLVLLFVGFFYGRPLGLLLFTKWEARNEPELWIVPKPLPVFAGETSAGRTFSYFGYEFESPWTEVKLERALKAIVVLNFATGQTIAFPDPAQNVDELKLLKAEAAKRGVPLSSVFGDEATRSRFALRSKILNLTPGDLRLFSTRQEMMTNSIFLFFKEMDMGKIKGGMYSFETGSLRGFQEGTPSQDDVVTIEAADSEDRILELWIASEHNAKSRPSQEDIDRIIFSLRPVSAGNRGALSPAGSSE